jgi:serine/threonine protein kinase
LLRAALESRLLHDAATGRPHYATVLGLALGVTRAMHHLHSEGVLHGDLKVC